MAKNIVICSDGTGNTATKGRGTNVFKLYEAVALHDHWGDSSKPRQYSIYDDGVGTESFKPLKILGGAFGWGLARNVRQLYTELCRMYEPDDNIYIFGFSRGAFTARTLAGLICNTGVIKAEGLDRGELDRRVKLAYRVCRYRYKSFLSRIVRKPELPQGSVHEESDKIKMVGVWDTVDAVGFPVPYISDLLNYVVRFKFPNMDLDDKVEQGFHALSVDDARKTFHPLLWNDRKGVSQVWFAGVHTNVGGGYPKQGVSLVTLDWMMRKAARLGLRFVKHDEKLFRAHKNVYDKVYDSRSGVSFFYRYAPRNIHKLAAGAKISSPDIHVSVFDRTLQGVEGYAPCNIPADCNIVALDNQGQTARFSDAEASVRSKVGGEGCDSLLDHNWLKRVVQIRSGAHYLFMALGIAFVLYLVAFGNLPQDVCPALNWSCLKSVFGVVANDSIAAWLLGISLLALAFELIGRSIMRRLVSSFWIKAFPDLEMALRKGPD